ncbi:MAG: 2Fe-2S iron-sulfur cluster-binding protein, partial [Planctomycetota bacterium]|nr:2Fe-2S iron-sulfur cluster-binding protein [Planctomycetota bacterium]
RVRNAQRLEDGYQFRLGQQTFVFSLGAASAPPAASAPMPQVDAAAPAEAPAEAPAAETSAAAATGPVTVKFKGAAEAIVVKPGQTLCEAAEEGGVEITAECHSGICGSDPIRILSGRDNLDGEPAELERETLEDICEVEPGECRLACMVRASGPVEVEIL